MIGPRHSIESVARDLAEGLENGTIHLRPETTADIDIADFESMMRLTLARYRRIETTLRFTILIAGAAGVLLSILSIVSALGFDTVTRVVLLTILIGIVVGFLVGLKQRERSIEIETYLRVLKLSDPKTARRLIDRMAPRLREREAVH